MADFSTRFGARMNYDQKALYRTVTLQLELRRYIRAYGATCPHAAVTSCSRLSPGGVSKSSCVYKFCNRSIHVPVFRSNCLLLV